MKKVFFEINSKDSRNLSASSWRNALLIGRIKARVIWLHFAENIHRTEQFDEYIA
jgi:hypothetical protein